MTMRDLMPCFFFFVGFVFVSLLLSLAVRGVVVFHSSGRRRRQAGRQAKRTMVMATVLARVAGGFRIVTRAIERMMARTMRTICVMWTR